jgi:hypothetical protein
MSIGTPSPKVGIALGGFTPSHFPTLPGICDVTPGLSFSPHPCNPFALVASLKAKVTTFYVDLKVYVVENNCNLDIINSSVKNLDNSHVIIQALNTTYLRQHYKYINYDHNFQMFHIFMSYKNKNTPWINRCAQIYKFIKVFIYFNP